MELEVECCLVGRVNESDPLSSSRSKAFVRVFLRSSIVLPLFWTKSKQYARLSESCFSSSIISEGNEGELGTNFVALQTKSIRVRSRVDVAYSFS